MLGSLQLITSAMRLLILSLVCILIGTSSSSAQKKVFEEIENQFNSSLHKSFLYQVSPGIWENDVQLLELFNEQRQIAVTVQELPDELPKDTTWSYSERKVLEDSLFTPRGVSHQYILGDTLTNYEYYDNYFGWSEDSLKWDLSSTRRHYVSEGHRDSLFVSFPNGFNPDQPITYRKIFPRIPADDADYEELYQNYNWDAGAWEQGYQRLVYWDESGLDTLYIEYEYNEEIKEHQLSRIERQWKIDGENISYRHEYFENGVINNVYLTEFGLDYRLFSVEEFSALGVKTSGSLKVTQLDEEGHSTYTVTKWYDPESTTYIAQDSLSFIYGENNSITEAEGFTQSDSGWVFISAFSSYSSLNESGEFLVDSTLVFEVAYNQETGNNERIKVSEKTEMLYDEHGNMTSKKDYQNIDQKLQLIQEMQTEYIRLISSKGNYYYAWSKRERFLWESSSETMHRRSLTEVRYDSTTAGGGYLDFSDYSFSLDGEITSASKNEIEILSDGRYMRSYYEWDLELNGFVLYEYYIEGDSSMNQILHQSSKHLFSEGVPFYTDRAFYVKESYPGIFNDGPILFSQGDTISIYLSALNPDFTVPEVEISNLPATASFNPETRHFLWIVDEQEPNPMTYKAIRGDKNVTVQVEFITRQLITSNEDELDPNEFELFQNFPNPFNPQTTINYSINNASEIRLDVFNIAGQKVATLYEGLQQAGKHEVVFDARNLSSGIYLYRLKTADKVKIQKMALIK